MDMAADAADSLETPINPYVQELFGMLFDTSPIESVRSKHTINVFYTDNRLIADFISLTRLSRGRQLRGKVLYFNS